MPDRFFTTDPIPTTAMGIIHISRKYLLTIWDDFRPGRAGNYLQLVGCNAGSAPRTMTMRFRELSELPKIGGVECFHHVGNPLEEFKCSVARS